MAERKKAELSAVDAELPTLAVLQEEVEAKIAAYALPQRNENCLVSLGKAVAFETAESETVNKINNGIAEDFASIEVNGWIQIDLGEALPLEEVYVLCYSADARYYHYKIYTSADGVDFTLLADKNDAVSDKVSGGNRFCANGVQARYVRIVGTLNSMSVSNPDNSDIHVKEMQVYTTAADYGAVDEARGKVPADLSIYTSETVQILNDALAAVTAGKNATEQATVDDYAKAINDALAALILKDADYSAVNTAKSKMPTDLSLYTDASANAVIAACNAVVTGKKITEQSVVDGYAAAIEAAIMALVPKQTEKNEEQAKEQIKEEADREEDTFSVPIIVSVSVCAVGAAGVVSFTILRKRGHLGK